MFKLRFLDVVLDVYEYHTVQAVEVRSFIHKMTSGENKNRYIYIDKEEVPSFIF